MNTTTTSPELAALKNQLTDLLNNPGHTQLHRVLRANAAANLATATTELQLEQRITCIEKKLEKLTQTTDELLWAARQRMKNEQVLLRLARAWYFYAFTAPKLKETSKINGHIRKLTKLYNAQKDISCIERKVFDNLKQASFDIDIDLNEQQQAVLTECSRRCDVISNLIIEILEETHEQGQPK